MKNIFNDICWSFKEDVPDSLDEFKIALKQYNIEIAKKFDEKSMGENIVYNAKCIVEFEGVVDGDYDEMKIEIVVDNDGCTGFEFLYLVHRELHGHLVDADHVFFEGFEIIKDSKDEVILRVMQGS